MAEKQTDTEQSKDPVDGAATEEKGDTSTESLLSSEATSGDKSKEGGEKSLLSSDDAVKVPEEYDLKLPEETGLEATHVEKIAAYAKEQGFSNEQAQALLERDSELLGKADETFQEKQEEAVRDYNVKLLESARSDSEIGGDKLPESAEKAKRFFKAIGSEKLLAYLNNQSFGNDPEIIRLGYHGFERFMSEGKLESGGAAVPKEKRTAEEIMYGSKKDS